MKRIGFALAAGLAAVVARPAAAQDVVVTAPAPVAPVVVAGGSVVESEMVTTKTRRGLFGRLRSRFQSTTTVTAPAAPVVTTPAPVVVPATPAVVPAIPAVPAVPLTMPAKPGGKVAGLGEFLHQSTMTTQTVVPAAGVVVADAPAVITAGYTTVTESQSGTATRRGLFGRMLRR